MFSSLGEVSPLFLQGTVLSLVVGEVILIGVVIYLLVQNKRLQGKLRLFFSGKEAKDLESILTTQLDEVKELDQEIQ